MIQHFLITRFNLRFGAMDADKRGRAVRTSDWLDDRIGLFEHYCLPSVLHQRQHDFRWLILLDRESDDRLRQRARRWAESGAGRIEPVYLPPVERQEHMARPVLERLEPDTELLVTTRLDNDDALHEDALAEVRRRVRPGRREFLNLRLGYVTDGRAARVTSHKYSPFTTLVEPRGASELRTVHCGLRHGRVRRFAPVRQIAERPLWLRVVHDRNLANRGPAESGFGRVRSLADARRAVRHLGRTLRTTTWPRDWRRERPLDEIADEFHLGAALS